MFEIEPALILKPLPNYRLLIEAVLSQQDHKMPHQAWDKGGSFDDQVWQQAISALHNQDENHCTREMCDDESVLFQLIQSVRPL
ncbi:hypothetical protein BDM02DRAFT_3192971 [Thelephora ganbajun]|uniref:Uncharacterized protein n=1 Tax=Thelephora ganbajun TaxID=370292 RepID=A0ACB6YYQ5_THEGA|nr:hypothetical protein BDM02DRAFT_3192971 [Thelephora ganbajun]